MPTFLTAYRWELRKLVSQKRTYLGLGATMAVPLIFVTALSLQSGSPNDVAFGKYVRESGLAIPLVLLLFASVWLFPLVTALVAGDIIASEHHNGTLKTIFTRSLDRGQIFVGKLLAAATYALLALVLMGGVALIAGTLKSGFHPLISLSGTHVSASHGLLLVLASFAVYLMPTVAIVCIGLFLSAVTRNSAAAVVGTLMAALLMQLIGILPGLGGARAVPADDAVPGLAGVLPGADRLAADRPGRLGVRDLRRPDGGGRLPDLLTPRRRRRLMTVLPGLGSTQGGADDQFEEVGRGRCGASRAAGAGRGPRHERARQHRGFPEGYLAINPKTCKFLVREIDQPLGPAWTNLRTAFIWEDARHDAKLSCLTKKADGAAGGVTGAVAGYAQVKATGPGQTVTATCPTGDIVLGGGNIGGEVAGSYPSSTTSWTIVRAHDNHRATITAVATCAADPPS